MSWEGPNSYIAAVLVFGHYFYSEETKIARGEWGRAADSYLQWSRTFHKANPRWGNK